MSKAQRSDSTPATLLPGTLSCFARTSVGLIALLVTLEATAHGAAEVSQNPNTVDFAEARKIQFPAVPGFELIVADLHSHSVFSDGHVWPKIRIEEALRDGLDAFAVTEHLEYQPHLADIPHPDRNRSTALSRAAAEGTDLLVIAGSEITRELPAGHINAIFVTDANQLFKVTTPPADPADVGGYYREAGAWPAADAVKAANDQGAFVFINHPDWTRQRPSGIAELSPLHEALIANKHLHGIEVANEVGYSAEAFDIALKNDLTLLGVSDIHDLIDWDYPPQEGAHRPVTLVLAQERTEASLREALFAGNTVVWFGNLLIGRSAQLNPVLEASLKVAGSVYAPDTSTLRVTFVNESDARFDLKSLSDITFAGIDERFSVPPHSEITIVLKLPQRVASYTLALEVENALLAPKEHPTMRFSLSPELAD